LSLQAMRAQHARTRTQGRGTEQSRVTQKDAGARGHGTDLQAMRAQHARTRTQGRGTEQSRVTQKDATSLKIPPDPIVKVRKKYAKKTRLMEKTRTVKTY